jgi:hypothetical protein
MRHAIDRGWVLVLALVAAGCSGGDSSSGDTSGDNSGGDNSSGTSAGGSSATTTTGGGQDQGTGGALAGVGGGSAGSSAGGNKSGAGGAGTGGGGSSGVGGAGGSVGTGMLTYMCADMAPDVAAPPSTWVNSTGNLANMQSECGNLGLVSANPCSNMVIAGIAQKGLWGTEDGGKSWVQLGSGAGSAKITNRISAVVYDPAHPGTFWESGIYNGGGVYKTTDNGMTFKQVGNITHNDSVSIDFSDPDRKTMLAGFHETNGKVWKSSDAGATWTTLTTVPGGAGYCTATQVLSATNLLVGCNNGGVYQSADGNAWKQVGSTGVIPQPLLATDGSVYWPGTQGGIQASFDHGATFTKVADGSLTPGMVGSIYPAELPDGRIVVVGKDHLQISADKGKTWKPIGAPLPYAGGGYDGARGPAYSARTKTFYIWKWGCGNNVLPDAIMSMGFDYKTQ